MSEIPQKTPKQTKQKIENAPQKSLGAKWPPNPARPGQTRIYIRIRNEKFRERRKLTEPISTGITIPNAKP